MRCGWLICGSTAHLCLRPPMAHPCACTQLLVFSFSLIIALMVGTFYFVFSVGGVRLNGI